jgi:hypothetical protein
MIGFLALCRFELRALFLLGKHSTTWVTTLSLFVLGIFQIGPHIYAWVSMYYDLTVYTSNIAWMIGRHHHAWLFICWMKSCKILTWDGLQSPSFWAQPLEYLGLRAWATTVSHIIGFLRILHKNIKYDLWDGVHTWN